MRKIAISAMVFGVFAWAQPAMAVQATAAIKGTAENSTITGEAIFTETTDGLDVEVKVANVPAGKHGFHIHENGSCDDMGKAAGGHYNPDGVTHGMVVRDGFEHAHPGDLGNIEIADDGTGTLNTFVVHLSLSTGNYNVAGKSVILHEKEDDFSQPTGNAGGRIGCGIIIVGETTTDTDASTMNMNREVPKPADNPSEIQ